MSQQKLEQLTKAIEGLEGSITKLEKAVGSQSSSAGPSKPFIEAWDVLVNDHLNSYYDLSKKIGGEVEKHAELVSKAFNAERDLLVFASKNKKVDDTKFQQLLAPISKLMNDVKDFKEKNRTSKQFNHLSTMSEGITVLAWVCQSLPAPFISECRGSSEFFSNKILTEFKNKDATQVQWVKSFNEFMKELHLYAKNYHTQGLSWN